jgi:hypothetical protein
MDMAYLNVLVSEITCYLYDCLGSDFGFHIQAMSLILGISAQDYEQSLEEFKFDIVIRPPERNGKGETLDIDVQIKLEPTEITVDLVVDRHDSECSELIEHAAFCRTSGPEFLFYTAD